MLSSEMMNFVNYYIRHWTQLLLGISCIWYMSQWDTTEAECVFTMLLQIIIKQILNFVEFNTHWYLPSEKTYCTRLTRAIRLFTWQISMRIELTKFNICLISWFICDIFEWSWCQNLHHKMALKICAVYWYHNTAN